MLAVLDEDVGGLDVPVDHTALTLMTLTTPIGWKGFPILRVESRSRWSH